MENPTNRQRMLPDYDARGALGGPYSHSSPKFPFRHSEVDFSDVFGGPPRCSMEEVGHSNRESVILSRKEEELPSAHSDPWAGLGQSSVFGEQSPSRRLLAKDFYDDIFKVDDPLGSRRRYSDIAHCSASIPVSRVLSPVHPSIPNTHEPSLAKPTLLRQFSLSRLGRRTDNLASAPLGSINPNRSKHGVGGSQRLKDQGSPGNSKESSHFSLYKWATKGMPLTSAFKGGNRKDSNLLDKKTDIPSGSAMGSTVKIDLSLGDENTLAKVLAIDKRDGIGSDSFEHQYGNKEKMPSKAGPDTLNGLLSKDDGEIADVESSFPNDHYTQHKVNHDNLIDSVKRENAQQAHKRRLGKENIHKGGNATKLPQNAPVIKEVVGKRDQNGKVQEFVKMFSHEEQSKPTRRRESNALKLKKNLSQQTKLEERSSKKSVEHDVKVNPMPEQPEQLHFGNKGSISETFDTSVECIEVENIIENNPKQTLMNQQGESIQILDAKIKKWSNGKKENLRALLSTLQYVLWPESGWKPVPLVDIIESASVKRAYQKTMLYLHPDKLQQKGASLQQKYTAEKVFDILQEAWTHFDALTAF